MEVHRGNEERKKEKGENGKLTLSTFVLVLAPIHSWIPKARIETTPLIAPLNVRRMKGIRERKGIKGKVKREEEERAHFRWLKRGDFALDISLLTLSWT